MQDDIDQLATMLSKLPGLGKRSARRAVLYLLKKKTASMLPLAEQIKRTAENTHECHLCGNFATTDPCSICSSTSRDKTIICVVEDVDDIWAMERSGSYRGQYHVLGGLLSALDGIMPDDLRIAPLLDRVGGDTVKEVIMGLSATVDGQSTAHYLMDALKPSGVSVTHLAHGLPVGGELDFMDDGTITMALKARKEYSS
jgi:recombination protein RecR